MLHQNELSPKENLAAPFPIINCHTHIFTSDYVPPLLAKTFLPEPFYRILNVKWLVRIAKWWFNDKTSPNKWPYQRWYRRLAQLLYKIKISTTRSCLLGFVKFLIGLMIAVSICHEFYKFYNSDIKKSWPQIADLLKSMMDWLERNGMLIITDNWFIKGALLILLLTFFPSGRRLLFFVLRKTSGFFKMLPSKQTLALARRYINIVKLARYEDQFRIFSRLSNQYPSGSSMVVLPMDMEFMGAGQPLKSFRDQMDELLTIKRNHTSRIYPFIFVDPRRISVGEEVFFDYEVVDHHVRLKPCFIKRYIEDHGFSGFKIYPALGYYPFEERLLALWKYAADRGIPIMTHCIRGTIFYRGKKKEIWDRHPVFEQYEGDEDDRVPAEEYFKPMLLQQMDAVDVQEIFTHPMNYACLLKKEWLVKLVSQAKDSRIGKLFGYDASTQTLSHGLENLKICFGHFGGDDDWELFLERDRDNWGHQIQQHPERGIDFLKDSDDQEDRRKAEGLWKYADWYSLICSMMLQHPNIYADISYILHGESKILPLLRQTLLNPALRTRVLYGTDFYVVRNHKSDKQMLAEIMNGLSTEDFDQIARVNPRNFLNI